MNPFAKYLRTILELAEGEARLDGSPTLEAHHVLLAMAARPETNAAQILIAAGLDHRAIRDALAREFEHGLRAAGVTLALTDLPRPSERAQRAPQLGASVRHALERGATGVRRDLQPAHLLLGILQAQHGTVPRALALAGIDRADLIARIQQTLDERAA